MEQFLELEVLKQALSMKVTETASTTGTAVMKPANMLLSASTKF